MGSSSAIPPPTPSSPSSLFASIDMGTNSFKLLIVRAHPTGRFLPLLRRKDPVLLGRLHHQTPSSPFAISAHSELRAIEALDTFQTLLWAHNIPTTHTRCVATSAVREAANKSEFLENVREKTGLEVDILSGEEEARLVYLGTLQFFPVFEKLVLCVDIGGGSTEFVVGKGGNVVFARSLTLGHVSLSQRGFGESEMREYIRSVMEESGLVENVKRFGFEVVVGSSGTIQALEKAVFDGYGDDDTRGNVFGVGKRDWRLSRGELMGVVERLCGEGEQERERRERFFKRRSEFIVAGAVLLEEIFEALCVEEMEVSGFALGEGVVAEILSKVYAGSDLNANARWRSVVRLATRFDGKKRMVAAAQCAGIAKEIFEELRTCEKLADNQVVASLDEKDLECLEAACMLHNIGLFTGKKGYHKQSYRIIMNVDHLHGYSVEEIKLIALLVRHHRKKLPKLDHSSFKEIPKEVKKKFKCLCAVIRVSVALWQHQFMNDQEMQSLYSHEGFNFKSVSNLSLNSLFLSYIQRINK